MSENLVIVESPAKAKTIEKFLGKGFKVESSYGHVRDLPKTGMAIDIENNFTPTYEVSETKIKQVSALKKLVKKANTIWLATDEDREGEAIAWHLFEALDLQQKETKRIVFHEITKTAILDAVENPRQIDQQLVNAQQARRILDRLVGYELSPVLWKKIQTGLSAGRVQSVAVRIIVEREREIEAFIPEVSFKTTANFVLDDGTTLNAKRSRDLKQESEVEQLLNSAKDAQFVVSSIEMKPSKRSPRPPFTTSTLQQEAAQKLGFSVKQTMTLAQRLYEAGRITYMRTDSVSLSNQAVGQAGNVIEKEFGKDFLQTRKYKTKSAGAQEAHEAIRPTDFSLFEHDGDRNQQRLYKLIWQRAIASQMADAKLERTTAQITADGVDGKFVAKGEIVTFAGFLSAYGDGTKNDDTLLPPMTEGEQVKLEEIIARESFTRHPPRYAEASLVKALEEMGIGRPSTYAPTISTIQDRGYIEKDTRDGWEREVIQFQLKNNKIERNIEQEMTGAERNKLFPTDIAGIVTDFLVKHFPEVIDFKFTAYVEREFDDIAAGDKQWQEMLKEFYSPFHTDIEKAADVSREEAAQTRELGIDPESGKPVFVKIGRFGPYVQLGSTEEEEKKPQFAGLSPGQKMDKITLEEALPLFSLPRILGETAAGEEVTVNAGRFGPYASYTNQEIQEFILSKITTKSKKGVELVPQHVSIEPEDPHTTDLETVLPLIEQKKEADLEKEIALFEGSTVQVLDGRWGPYITNGFKNAKIPKDKELSELTLELCEQILEESKKERKRLIKQYYGGGFLLINNCDGLPDLTIKAGKGKEKLALEIAAEIEERWNKKVRVISASGAAAQRLAAKRQASAKTTAKKKAAPKKKAATKKKSTTKKRATKKKAATKKKSATKKPVTKKS